jgi:hypothetical protein
MTSRPDLELVDLTHSESTPRLHGSFRVESLEAGALRLIGWAFGKESPVAKVELVSDGKTIAHTTPEIERPDVAEAFRDVPDAARCGFQLSMTAEGSGDSHLDVEAELADGGREPLGKLLVRVPEPATGSSSPRRRLRNRLTRW